MLHKPCVEGQSIVAGPMNGNRTIAWVLIGLGAVALLGRIGAGTGWLWVALAAAGFLFAYRSQRTYAFLVIGGVLAGVSAGILFEGAWNWDGAFLLSLGAGFLVIDQVEPKPSRWPVYPAAILVGLGLITWLFSAGILGSIWFPILLILAGLYLLLSRSGSNWVRVKDPEVRESSERQAQASPGREGPAAGYGQSREHAPGRAHEPADDQPKVPATAPIPNPRHPDEERQGEGTMADVASHSEDEPR